MTYGMSANQKVVQLFEIALGMSQQTNYAIEEFFSSDVWQRYGTPDDCPNPSTWNEVVQDILQICTKRLEWESKHPAVFRGDE